MSKDEYSYKAGFSIEELTEEDKKRGAVIAKLHKQAATQHALLEDKMYYLILNEKPKRMSQKNWIEMVKKVVRVEIVQKYPKLFATIPEEQPQSNIRGVK